MRLFSHTGGYGLWINADTKKIDLLNSLITDTGAGGIWIGRELVDLSQIANSIKIISNEISYGGNVFPCIVGIVDSTSSDVIIADSTEQHILCDQGGIYTIGALKNTAIHDNVIKTVFARASIKSSPMRLFHHSNQ